MKHKILNYLQLLLNENKEETKTWKKLTIEEKIIKFKDYIDKKLTC